AGAADSRRNPAHRLAARRRRAAVGRGGRRARGGGAARRTLPDASRRSGGVLLWAAMGGALVMAVRTSYLVAMHAGETLQDAATAIVCLQLTVLCLCLTGPVFNTQLGIQFWALSGAVLGPLLASGARDLEDESDG